MYDADGTAVALPLHPLFPTCCHKLDLVFLYLPAPLAQPITHLQGSNSAEQNGHILKKRFSFFIAQNFQPNL
jgi:hypothetical protein